MNDDFLKQFYQEPPEAYNRQLREQLAQIEQEQESRSNHTHKENKDMNTIALPQRRDPPLDIFARHLLTGIVAVLMAAFVFILMVNSPLIHSPGFLGIFQDVEEYQRDQVELYINQAWNTGDTAILADLLSDDHVTTTTIFGTVEGIDGVADLIRRYRTAMPDFTYTINQISSEDGTVWLHGTIKGTHTGSFVLPDGTEIPPSGNSVTIDSVIRFTFEGNKISAINQVDSSQDLMEQLGAAQPVEEVATQNHNIQIALLSHDRSLPLPPDDVPREQYRVFNPFSYLVHIPFGDFEDLFRGNFMSAADRNQFASLVLDRDVTIQNITAGGDFVAFHTAVTAIYNPDHPWQSLRYDEAFLLSGDKVSWENVSIYRIDHGRRVRIQEAWWYWDFEEMAAYDYGWTRADE